MAYSSTETAVRMSCCSYTPTRVPHRTQQVKVIISQICGLLHKMFLFHSPNSGTSKSKAQLSINGEFKTAASSHTLLHILYSGKPHTTLKFQQRLESIWWVKGQLKYNCTPTTQRKGHKCLGGDWQNELNSIYSKASKSCTLNMTTTTTLIRSVCRGCECPPPSVTHPSCSGDRQGVMGIVLLPVGVWQSLQSK